MKHSWFSVFLPLALVALLFSACKKDDAPQTPAEMYVDEQCEGANGTVTLNLQGGGSWGSACATGILTDLSSFPGIPFPYTLSIIGYSAETLLEEEGIIETLVINASFTALVTGDILNVQQIVFTRFNIDDVNSGGTPDLSQTYAGGSASGTNISITNINNNRIQGTYSFLGINVETEEELQLSGTFDVEVEL
jgi:hypothetical protein